MLGNGVMITKNSDDIVKGKHFCLVLIKLKIFEFEKNNFNNYIFKDKYNNLINNNESVLI